MPSPDQGSVLTEVREALRNNSYFLDPWNKWDMLLLISLATGCAFRLVGEFDRRDDEEDARGWTPSTVSHIFFACSSPLLFSRVLFYLQIFPAQGPLIRVIFSMIKLLVNFSVVLGVVILGFAVAFFALFWDAADRSGDDDLNAFSTFEDAVLTLFGAMLGDYDLRGFGGSMYGNVGTALMVVYLALVTIMLLNLLIAVLSTAHATVDKNVEKEFNKARALAIMHYSDVVRADALPAPLNLVQEALCFGLWVCGRSEEDRSRARLVSGRLMFSLVFGPLAISVAAILWAVSLPKVLCVLPTYEFKLGNKIRPRTLTGPEMVLLVFVACFGGIPIYLALMWLKSLFIGEKRGVWAGEDETPGEVAQFDISKELKEEGKPISVTQIRHYLMNPLNGERVHPHDKDHCANIQHIKLLKQEIDIRFSELREGIDKKFTELRAEIGASHQIFEDLISRLGQGSRSSDVSPPPSRVVRLQGD
ncbi:unnamed protein product [Discosporangium mesarthrocarpum]